MGFTACVIGGGPAGIAATLNLRRAGGMVTCMELNPTVGGMWAAAHGPTVGTHGGNLPGSGYAALGARGLMSPIYPSMRCVLPKDAMAFSDMRFSFLVPQYPHYAAVHDYLQEYAMRKGVHGLVRYNTWVESVQWLGDDRSDLGSDAANVSGPKKNALGTSHVDTTRNADGKENVWLVRTVNVITGDVTEWKFDCVVVASGRHHRPRIPDPFNYNKQPLNPGGDDAAAAEAPKPNAPAVMAPLEGQLHFVSAGGQVLHASEVKKFRDFRSKVVVVYGNGVTAFEYAKELQRAGALVVHATEHERDMEGLDKEAATRSVSDMALDPEEVDPNADATTRTMDQIRKIFDRYSPLNNPRFVTNMLSRRNARLRQSLRGTLHTPTGWGGINTATGLWERDLHKPKAGGPVYATPEEAEAAEEEARKTAAQRVAPALSESLEALRGAYAEIPVLGDIMRLGPKEPTAAEVAEDAEAAAADEAARKAKAEENSKEGSKDASSAAATTAAGGANAEGDRDIVVRLTNDEVMRSQRMGAGAMAADAVADAAHRTEDVRQSNALYSPTKLLSIVKRAELSPYERKSVAILSRFGLVREDPTNPSRITGLRVKSADALICCTGYYQSYPYLRDASIRNDVEFSSRRPQLRLPTSDAEAGEDAAKADESDEPERRRIHYKGLYLGTVLRRNPTIAFIGLQAEIVPPFLLFEAQTAYYASLVSGRVPLPQTEQLMDKREHQLRVPSRRLASVRGLGVGGSANFYTALVEEAGLTESHYGYYETMWNARRFWFLGTWGVNTIHGAWSLTPQKRRKQHVVISNEV
jgi:cation diffusion facilitator CzcD-associated flavoprotein CzcO